MKKFFLFCAGIDQEILEKCPSDENKYVGIGATVFFTGVMALFSGGYALYTVFDSWFFALLFGGVWGLMIFNLDRYIVSSMKSHGKFGRDFLIAFPRLVLALLLALVISKPLELKIFDKEINAELIVMEQEVFKTQEDKIKERYESQIIEKRAEVAGLKSEIAAKTASRDTLALMALQEADGTGGSRNRNLGPIYRAKKLDAENAQAELDALLAAHQPRISLLETEISAAEASIQSDISSLKRDSYGGLAARMEALDRLSQRSEAIYLASIFVILLFIAIETAPIMVKLISHRSPYDYLLHEHEHVYQMAHHENTTLLANKIANNVKYNTEVGTYQVNAKIAAEKKLIDAALEQRVESLKDQPINWDDVFLRKSILE
ncbi:MAG: DUF4407 domain-containing protein [Saprospiraceae bacterium]